MKKIFLLYILVFFSYNCIFADMFEDFLRINNGYFQADKVYFAKQKLETYKNDEKISALKSYSIYSKDNQFVNIFEANKETFFLSTDKGYYISSPSLRSPLKVSGSYQVDEIAIQDILRFDFLSDFEVINDDKNEILMARKNKKNPYAFAKLSKEQKDFILILQDAKKNDIKKIVYRPGIINSIEMFTKIIIYNQAIDTLNYKCYVTETIETLQVPVSLFTPENMKNLADYGNKYFK